MKSVAANDPDRLDDMTSVGTVCVKPVEDAGGMYDTE
jgi:hypothetical protein